MTLTAEWSHRTRLGAEPRSAGLARDFVRLHLRAHELPHLVEDICLVVSELATNAVVHAQTPFLVTLSGWSGTILLEIEDASASVPIPRMIGVMDTSGRGLAIVELLSQQWGTRPVPGGCKSVWASFAA